MHLSRFNLDGAATPHASRVPAPGATVPAEQPPSAAEKAGLAGAVASLGRGRRTGRRAREQARGRRNSEAGGLGRISWWRGPDTDRDREHSKPSLFKIYLTKLIWLGCWSCF